MNSKLRTIGLIGLLLFDRITAQPPTGTTTPSCGRTFSTDACCYDLFGGKVESDQAVFHTARVNAINFHCTRYEPGPTLAGSPQDTTRYTVLETIGPYTINCPYPSQRWTGPAGARYGLPRTLEKGFCLLPGEDAPMGPIEIVRPGSQNCQNIRLVTGPNGKTDSIAIRLEALNDEESSSSNEVSGNLKNVFLSWSRFSGQLLDSIDDRDFLVLPESATAGIYRACVAVLAGGAPIWVQLDKYRRSA